jgi:signal peptidase I
MLPDQRRGYWAAIARGLLTLVGAIVSPLLLLMAVIEFGFAWGIRRGQMWAAVAAVAFHVIPLPLVLWNRPDTGVWAIAIALLIELVFVWFYARAAIALGRAGNAAAGRNFWTAAIVFCAVFWVIFRPYAMPSGSMENTILTNENLFVRNAWRAPGHGDLVVFRYPVDPRQTFIKRVVGVPGDRLRIVNKQLYRNGVPVSEPFARHATEYVDQYRDNFPSAPTVHLESQAIDMLAKDVRNGEVVVPDGKYFVLGDNRDDSLDSRYWGFVSKDQIIGKPFLVYASYELGSTPETATRTILNTRWNRLLKVL